MVRKTQFFGIKIVKNYRLNLRRVKENEEFNKRQGIFNLILNKINNQKFNYLKNKDQHRRIHFVFHVWMFLNFIYNKYTI